MTDPTWYSVLPPLLAIVLAIWSKQVIPSLFAGIWTGHTLLAGFNPLAGLTAGLDGMISVFTDPGDARVLVFTLLVGSLIATIERTGGVRGFVQYLDYRDQAATVWLLTFKPVWHEWIGVDHEAGVLPAPPVLDALRDRSFRSMLRSRQIFLMVIAGYGEELATEMTRLVELIDTELGA